MVSKFEITDPDFIASFKALEARVSKLERTPQVLNAAIDSRGIDIFGGGEIRVHEGAIRFLDNNGNTRVLAGHLPDGSYDLAAYTADESMSVNLATLAFGMQADFNTNNGATTSLTYIDLGNVGDPNFGPQVTCNIGTSGRALVMLSCEFQSTPSGNNDAKCAMSFTMSGANTLTAGDEHAIVWFQQISNISDPIDFNNFVFRCSNINLEKNLSPGLTTFTAKYRSGSGSATTANFTDRMLCVMPF